jgi:hypothetical protein
MKKTDFLSKARVVKNYAYLLRKKKLKIRASRDDLNRERQEYYLMAEIHDIGRDFEQDSKYEPGFARI